MDKKAFNKLSYGMYIISSRKDDKINGQIANTVFQVTSEPPTIAVSINKSNLTWEYIKASRVFAVSVLCDETPLSLIGQFGFKSGRDINKFEGISYKLGMTKSPVMQDYITAVFEAKVINELDVGTHTIFVGEIVDANIINDKPCMTYDYYHVVKRGTTPKTAPSYVAEEKGAAPGMDKYKCSVCGWIYDPAVGDQDGGIAPGVPFDKVPDDWKCPVCGAAKSEFEKI